MYPEEIAVLAEVSEGLEHSLKNAADCCNTLEELLNKIKSKRY